MKLEIAAIEQHDTDTKGQLAAVGVRTHGGDRHLLLLPFGVAEQLIAHLASAGVMAATLRGSDGTPPDGREQGYVCKATFAHAGIAPTGGGAHLVLRFGELTLSVDLAAMCAAQLAQDLLAATASGPARAQ